MAGERLILTGFMGIGKTTVGLKVSEGLGIGYQDTDSWLETESGIDIPNLVRTDMTKFRELEADALMAILDQEPGVISTGGGIVSTEIGRNALKGANVPVIWMDAPFEVAESRVSADSGRERPLFSDVAKARALYDERRVWYKETANHTVDASLMPEQVAQAIIALV